ncbi:hypothetical protein E1294_30810 [Nonomuraea diastatica]|uniref:Tn3 transposase DDE domain-containing protein n=1 Tax=Nonomuraea diastatica TaxID=1848329 RepID=A0A4R4WJD0_9ACTN|nr:hypothetical protein E1294_30810 [Nonomuraea diastatica]
MARFERPHPRRRQRRPRHRLARKIAFGNRGQLRQRYREGMEDQLGSLGLALNAVIAVEQPVHRRRRPAVARPRLPGHRRDVRAAVADPVRAHRLPGPLRLHPRRRRLPAAPLP